MAAPGSQTLTFLRGAGFRLDLVGTWDLLADASGRWPAQKGFLVFKETKITAVIERHATMRRGIEGTYTVEGNRLRITRFLIDTAPDRDVLGTGEFTLDGDLLTITWLPASPSATAAPQVDTFRRRPQQPDGALLPPVEIYESGL